MAELTCSENPSRDDVQEWQDFVVGTRATLLISRDDVSTMRQSNTYLRDTLNTSLRSPTQNQKQIELPENMPELIKDLVEKLSAVTGSSRNIEETLNLVAPDLEKKWRIIELRAAKLEEKNKSLEQRINALRRQGANIF